MRCDGRIERRNGELRCAEQEVFLSGGGLASQAEHPNPDRGRAAGGVLRGNGCRVFRLRRDKAGLAKGDLIMVVPVAAAEGGGQECAEPEGGEIVVDLQGRVGRHAGGRNADGRSGGPVWGVVVGVIHERNR